MEVDQLALANPSLPTTTLPAGTTILLPNEPLALPDVLGTTPPKLSPEVVEVGMELRRRLTSGDVAVVPGPTPGGFRLGSPKGLAGTLRVKGNGALVSVAFGDVKGELVFSPIPR
jgi:hypothetical protein